MIIDWVKKKLNESESVKALDEVDNFVSVLKRKNDQEVAMLLAIATIIRLNLTEKAGLTKSLLDDSAQSLEHRKTLMYLTGVIGAFQKRDQAFDAAGAMIWLYSLKSNLSPSVAGKTAQLWVELKRGFPYVEDKLAELASMTGNKTPAEALAESHYIPARIGF